jgi:CBS domain-containing protein
MFARSPSEASAMSRKTPISQLMTTHVRTLDVNAKLSEARRVLSQERIHHLPIVEHGAVVGLLSSRDLVGILREAEAGGSESVDAVLDRSSSIRRAMSKPLVTLRPDDPLERAIDLIADGSIHSLLVLDADRRLAGIVTDTDLLDYLCE